LEGKPLNETVQQFLVFLGQRKREGKPLRVVDEEKKNVFFKKRREKISEEESIGVMGSEYSGAG